MIGATVGNYRVVERLGDGGMGTVYRAVDEMLDREVAIKVLRPDLVRQAELIERFRQEAIALARLHHPHIATLFGLERHGDNLLMIMEYVRGETLEQIVLRSGRLTWPRAAELCSAVLEALDHAHDKGVVHRDIKPANVMLTHAGVVKVMDFGIARVMGKSRQTRMGNVVGTPMYMSPEQLKGEEVDGRSDLYAVGAVLFELVTGRVAFEADSDYQLMMKQLNEPPPPVAGLVPDAPPELDAIVQRAMAKRRDERFSDALVFRDALRALIAARARVAPPRVAAPATRLAVDAPAPPVEPAPRATAEQTLARSASAPETRLAAGEPSATPMRAVPPVETRLATERGDSAGGARGSGWPTPDAGGMTSWRADWRTYAAAAAILVAAGLTFRTLRPSPDPLPPSQAVGADEVSPAPAADAVPDEQPAQPATLAASASAADPTKTAGTPRRLVPMPSDGDVGTPRGAAPREERAGGTPPQGAVPPAAVSSTPKEDVESARAEPPHESPSVRAEDAEAAVAERLSELATSLGSASGTALLRGDDRVRDQWATLAREGRISVSPAGRPSIQVSGSRASVSFDATLTVRSPFGATRKRTTRLDAEFARSGSDWEAVSVRVPAGLDLK